MASLTRQLPLSGLIGFTLNDTIRLTQYSHGAGCGCKISPAVLERILGAAGSAADDIRLLVGNQERDDAAVFDLGDSTAIISTTDFFMPIVDDPETFGRIAATNAISDIYAMGGQPLMAIALLGWPVSKLGPDVAGAVLAGGRHACLDAGIPLAGGHSIEAPEPIFGLAVTGRVEHVHLKRNSTAQVGDQLILTKPLGVGVLTTALKQGKLKHEHSQLAPELMCTLNTLGPKLAQLSGVHAMTDVTGFGLLGHLKEMCDGSDVSAQIRFADIPILDCVRHYVNEGCVPGGSHRNLDSYGHAIGGLDELNTAILCDPQTSGGLLLSVEPNAVEEVIRIAAQNQIAIKPFGEMTHRSKSGLSITLIP